MPKLSWKNEGIHDSHKYLGWPGFPPNSMSKTLNVHTLRCFPNAARSCSPWRPWLRGTK